MAEFLLKDTRDEKNEMYDKMREMFECYSPDLIKDNIPFKNGFLPCISIGDKHSEKTLLVHGGYDSFIEEFYPLIKDFAHEGYHVLLFEGAGQGETLRHHLKFSEKWEDSVSVILDYYNIKQAAIIGISWGGFLALRAGAFDKRLTHVISFGDFYDGLDVQFSLMNPVTKHLFTFIYKLKLAPVINYLLNFRSPNQADTP